MISHRAGRGSFSKFYEAITGWKLDKELWNKKHGRRIVQIQRAFLFREDQILSGIILGMIIRRDGMILSNKV